MSLITPKCHFCYECNGTGCISELPGMGGIRKNINFQLNCSDWNLYPRCNIADEELEKYSKPKIRLAPITGGTENIGFADETQYYYSMIEACAEINLPLCIGDGCPDIKLKSGIDAVSKESKKAAVFIKPYENARIFERIEWAKPVAEIIGVDIDAYNIVTMRNLVHLEKKDADKLIELKKNCGFPFAIKGVFTHADLDLIKQVKPDIVAVSNHGGRVDNRTGSTIDFLAEHHKEIAANCGEIWIDGGIRRERDLFVASYFGAKQVMLGRPLISALCRGGKEEVADYLKRTFNYQ